MSIHLSYLFRPQFGVTIQLCCIHWVKRLQIWTGLFQTFSVSSFHTFRRKCGRYHLEWVTSGDLRETCFFGEKEMQIGKIVAWRFCSKRDYLFYTACLQKNPFCNRSHRLFPPLAAWLTTDSRWSFPHRTRKKWPFSINLKFGSWAAARSSWLGVKLHKQHLLQAISTLWG